MKKLFFMLVAIFSLGRVYAQDTIVLYNINHHSKMAFEAVYSLEEIDELIQSARVADSLDTDMLIHEFEIQKFENDFWMDAIIRYFHWPENATLADEMGFYYHPKSLIYVPDSDYVNAIIFDWFDDEMRIAVVAEDGLWVLLPQESLDERWEIYTQVEFIDFINFNY